MSGFVRARDHACAAWGVGKIIEIETGEATVSWFDSPITESRILRIPTKHLVRAPLERQTRVYWLDHAADNWRVGRILDADDISAQVRFANRDDLSLPLSALEVRWNRPIEDPSAFLAAQINASPLFAQARSRFSRSLIGQRGACSGMSGLLSSVIDLEQHQYEVVKRVLSDPVQRYLLADEVGLGKTIEAGVLIRQYILDNPRDHRALVIVPPALVVQWRRELRNRFLLGHLLDDSLSVMAMDTAPQRLVHALQDAGMVVIDEAHHLSQEPDLYSALREAIIRVPRLLLLSATPVLHNERGFLEMLHLLDPHVFRREDDAAFRQRIAHRQALAEAVAGLAPENLLQIDVFIDDLQERFPDDALLQEHAESLRNIVVGFPDENDPAYLDVLTRLRAHLTETYRLDRRILRNRRRDLRYLTPHRAGLKRIDYASADSARLIQAVESWRTAAAAAVYGREQSDNAESLAAWFRQLLEAALSDVTQVSTLAQDRISVLADSPSGPDWERVPLRELQAAAEQSASDDARLDAMRHLVIDLLDGTAKIIVFCSRSSTADTVTAGLQQALSVPVDRHAPHDDPEDDAAEQPWESFLSNPSHRVLVCDATGEEGLNLQGGEKVVIHYDLPLAPNRIEQRLGRADRYGSGSAVRSFSLCCSDDPYGNAWSDYLDQGLRLFNRSVASLQYVIEDEMRVLSQTLLFEGVDALSTLTARTGGERGTAERELRRIDDQDALDALTLPDEEVGFEALTETDGDWREIADGVQQWMVDILQIDKETAPAKHDAPFGFGAFRFCFSYQGHGSNALIPLKRVLSSLLGLLDPEAPGAHSRLLKTGWYSCRRGAATATSALGDGIRLVRWGESLIDRIEQLTNLDDRGRAAAMWRHGRNYTSISDAPADVFLRFDFIVETNVSMALQAIGTSDEPALERTLARRGDMALAPFYRTVWIDQGLSPVTDRALLDLLNAPYQKEPGDYPYRDWNLNPERWPAVATLGLPVMDVWRQWIPRARDAAEAILCRESGLEEMCRQAVERASGIDQKRFAQLRARLQAVSGADAESTAALLEREERVVKGLYAGILAPSVTLGTVVAVFLSAHPLGTITATGGPRHG